MSELKGGWAGTQMLRTMVTVYGHADISHSILADYPEKGDASACLRIGWVTMDFCGLDGLYALQRLAAEARKAAEALDAAILKASSPVVDDPDPVCVKCGRTALVNLGSKGWSCHGCLYDSDGMSGQGE